MRWKTAEYSGWGRAMKTTGRIARPEKQTALEALLAEEAAPAIGNRRSYGDAALNSQGAVIDMTRLDRLLAFDPETGVLRAEAGITIGAILKVFAPQGWMPAVMPGTGFATLGGCIANDVHGKNHHRDGSFGQHVRSLILIPPGEKARKISARSGKASFRATIGGLGQTGVIHSAEIQLIRCDALAMEVRETRVANLDEFLSAFETSAAPWSVGWIDATARGARLGRGVLEEATGFVPGKPTGREPGTKKVPMTAPRFLLAAPVVRAFNAAYFARIPEQGRTRPRRLEDFFFPLDRIHDWNKLYGKPGFHQFQCVLPDDSAGPVLHDMLEAIAASDLASPLAVLKRLGPGRAGMMSFPMEGMTLAVDFPNRDKARDLISRLEGMTADAGGRIYFAKDALSDGASISAMYPERADFAKTLAGLDPEGAMQTDLARRLHLREDVN